MRLDLGKTVPKQVKEIVSQPIDPGQPIVCAGFGEGIYALEDRLGQPQKPRGKNLSDLQLEAENRKIRKEIHQPGGSHDESIDTKLAAEVADKQAAESQQ